MLFRFAVTPLLMLLRRLRHLLRQLPLLPPPLCRHYDIDTLDAAIIVAIRYATAAYTLRRFRYKIRLRHARYASLMMALIYALLRRAMIRRRYASCQCAARACVYEAAA